MATTYNVYRDGEQIASELTSATYTDTDLSPNTTYEYQVSTVNDFGESELSTAISVTTDEASPDEPEGLEASDKTDTTVELEWE